MLEPEKHHHITSAFFGLTDANQFISGVQTAMNQVSPVGLFAGDNLFTFHRNLSFLEDEKLMTAFEKYTDTDIEKSVLWRTYVLAWAAKRAMKLPGDFVECGCYKGVTARILCDCLDFASSEKSFYLYDLFEHQDAMDHHSMPDHSATLYEEVCARFNDTPNVHITQGPVPDSLDTLEPPGDIAFLHIDMNNAAAEVGALERLFDKVTTGAVIVFDDYGWFAYREQKLAEDAFLAEHGVQILELPTGQGIAIK
tara:strand:+ start:212 stop:970 length:759 start_codon:yes stop_codon:yes gene_type:complete